MPFLTESDLTDIIYQEKIDEIKRDNANLVSKSIAGAIDEAKSYISRFDLDALFGTETDEPTVISQNLKDQVAAMACWRLCRVTSAGIDTEYIKLLNDDAVKWLGKVQKGPADPPGWKLKPIDPITGTQPGSQVTWSSNPKNRQHF